ncbi:MAG: aromatic ring-hydroxylating dioxygenase subunit alpha [Gemmatimonadetes bacterium]|nr:MAG: aromatic ring-hydroxylating dioxygenase subunit alpha [Gemmatimonadota bacterium]
MPSDPRNGVPIDVDADIRRAFTLPSRVYGDPEHFALQRERVFTRTWQFVGGAEELKAPGHVRPFTLLPGCLDEPLLLARGDDGALRCLSNVCTHRGALVVEGEGHQRFLRCRYHGRKFGLDGAFQSMPEFDGVEGFPCEADDLPELPLERWGPLHFTALAPAMPFDEWIAPVQERVGWLPLDELRFDPATSRDYTIDAHWALYCDNYLEEFHIPYIHGASLSDLDYDAYRTECFPWANLQFGYARGGDGTFTLPDGHPDAGEPLAAFYFWLFPNLMLNFYPWGLSVNVVQPIGPARTRVSFLSYVLDASKRSEGLGADLHRVEMEDEEVVASCQRGVRSRLYDRGRFSPRREVGTHHFHTLLARFLS